MIGEQQEDEDEEDERVKSTVNSQQQHGQHWEIDRYIMIKDEASHASRSWRIDREKKRQLWFLQCLARVAGGSLAQHF